MKHRSNGSKQNRQPKTNTINQALKNLCFFMIITIGFFCSSMTAFAASTIGLSPLNGPSGSNVTVSGAGFTPGITGDIWFDTNGNGLRDGNESSVIASANASGIISGTLTVPGANPGYYMVRIDAPSGGSIEAEALFHIQEPSLVLGLTSGKPGQPLIVSGRYFAPGKTGWVWFDTNSNFLRDTTEPAMQITSNVAGEFNASIIVPSVSAGAYIIRADLPAGDQSEGEAVFTALPGLSITPSSGAQGTIITVSGGGFEPSQAGIAWLDINKNGMFDTESESSTPVISDISGRVVTALPVPNSNISPGTYPVRIELPVGTPVKPTANFILSNATIALTTRKAVPGGTLIAYGSNFTPNTAGTLWFDSNDNGVQDADEFSRDLVSDKYGKFLINVVVPNAKAGVHAIRAVFQGNDSNSAFAKINVLTAPDLSLSISNGEAGSTVIIAGAYFATWTTGIVWLDTNGNGRRDVGEAVKTVRTDSFGKFQTPITIPVKSKPGACTFYADIPSLGRPEAASGFYINGHAVINTGSGPTNSGATLDVVSSKPYDDARYVKRMPIITVTFNTRIIKGSDISSISLADENGNTVRVRASISGRTLTIRLSQMLRANETYMLTVPANAVTDTRAHGMDDEYAITFTTKR